MPHRLRCAMIAALAVSMSIMAPRATWAQGDWPTRPLTLIVSYPPGGAADMLGRLIAPKMAETLGQPVVVENRPGGAGQIGAAFVARSKPDGYTMLLDGGGYAINPSLYPQLPYDPAQAFTPIGIAALFPLVVVVSPGYGAKTVAELVDLAKKAPNDISYASPGTGSTQHLAGVQFLKQTGLTMLHVPYKGGAPAMTDVMAGHVPLFFANIASSLSHIRAGKMRPLAVMAARRSAVLPDVPTLAEAGVKDSEAYEWNGVFVPSGVAPAIVTRLTDALRKALDSPEAREKLASVGGEPFPGGADEAATFIRDQMQRMGRLVREGNIRPE